MLKKYFSCVLTALLISVFSFGQTATIRGTITSERTGEAILFALVYLEGTPYGVQSDINGFYSLTKIPAGTYTLIGQQASYLPTKIQITVKAGEIQQQNIVLKDRIMTAVTISAKKQDIQENPNTGKNTMGPTEINRVVAIGGVADIAQSVQVL